ncbi:MATH domain-containing protein [Caenorhabditis elegans]|uniref:MATH domain-containing protein n=1 Tax=Caenorhabditis elegans TaxID=6239 RepID=O16551_CAEEL|nr:MATH domain-containing protein [Caenorhabditis elegans]CCD64669.1 MATH domain-containing protein [Caenorhabditis elegans]|eukprot:NP_494101.2 MATH (meprin-associated Traf homology) domain containing [Caenorhabditis elegans]
MFNSFKEFRINETVKNISRFVDDESYFTDTEERFNIPWRIEIKKKDGNFELFLKCQKEECENRKWSIETEYTLKLVSQNGKCLMKNNKYTFENQLGRGWEFVSWKELESEYVVDDSIVVEAHVKIVKMTDSPYAEDTNQKTFLLNHTVKNVLSIKEGGKYSTKTEKRFNIPWRLEIKRQNGFFGLYLQCDKKLCKRRSWTIEVKDDLRLLSQNGQSLNLTSTSIFEEPSGYGYGKLIRWDDMLEKYMVNDSIIIEARVKITKTIGCEDETSIDDLDDEFSDCVINVGGKNYSVKRQ